MLRRVLLLPLLLIAFAWTDALAQSVAASRVANDTIPFAPLGRPSYIWAGWPEGAMYEGDVNLPVPLWSRTSGIAQPSKPPLGYHDCFPSLLSPTIYRVRRSLDSAAAKPHRGCTITFVPHFVIRQLSGGSAPVQTPTFNPNFELTKYALYLEDTASAAARRATRGGGWRRGTLLAWHYRVGHYSNGQEGCLYTNQDPGNGCAANPALPEELNRKDGSFSTHYVEVGHEMAGVRFGKDGVERRLVSGSAAVRWNPPGLAPWGGMSGELARTYGRWSVTGSLAVRTRHPRAGLRFKRFRAVTNLSVDAECAPGRPDPYLPCRGAVGGFVSFPALYGAGIAARYVGGWDYYNVGYGQRLRNPHGWWPEIGIVLDHSVAMRVGRRASCPCEDR